jgi:hypothetical protein
MTRFVRVTPVAMALCFASACASAPAGSAAPPHAQHTPPVERPEHLARLETHGRVDHYTLAPVPDWTDRYAGSQPGDLRFFEIGKLMDDFNLSRAMAVELQNHFRDLSRAGAGGGPHAWFEEALARALRGESESGLAQSVIDAAAFVVVMDLDDTLYDQRVGPEAEKCADLQVPQSGGGTKPIMLAPGWSEAFARIAALGGKVVLFSANLDDLTYANLRAWKVGEGTILDQPWLAGVLTNSHLVRQSTHEGAGRADRRKGEPVLEASKDLRIVDPTLQKVVMVDDNPRRLFQLRHALPFPKFDGDRYCHGTPEERAVMKAVLPDTIRKLEESMAWAKANNASVAQALLPYSWVGEAAVQLHMQALGWTVEQAREHIRRHPEAADASW